MKGCQLVLLLGLLVWLASCDPQVGHDLAHTLQHSIVHMPTDVLDRLYTHHTRVTVLTIWEADQMSEQSWEASLEVLECAAVQTGTQEELTKLAYRRTILLGAPERCRHISVAVMLLDVIYKCCAQG